MNIYRERIYSNYVKSWDETQVPQSVSDFKNRAPTMNFVIKSFFPTEKKSKILDIGCGHGTLIHFAQKQGYWNTHGIDISEQQVTLAHKLGIKNVDQGDFMKMLSSMPAETLDAVVSFDVIEHFTKSELINFVDLVHASLKPGGRWIIHTLNANSPFFGAVRYGDFTHEQAFTPLSLKQLLSSSGFVQIDFMECAPRPHSIKSALRVVLWSWIRFVYRFIFATETGNFVQNKIITQNFYTVALRQTSKG